MGSTVIGDTIFISKDLSERINQRERKVLLAHELSHYFHRDWIKMLLIKPLELIAPKIADKIKCNIEIRADKEAIIKTRDPRAYLSLLDKLERKGNSYPTKEYSKTMATNMAGKL